VESVIPLKKSTCFSSIVKDVHVRNGCLSLYYTINVETQPELLITISVLVPSLSSGMACLI
jgi:hypothetical protein